MFTVNSLKNLPTKVRIMEVGPRDGLQNEKTFVDTESKIKLIESLADAGLKRIEVTAFVSPRWIPPLADQMEVARALKKKPGVLYAALVPNVQGYERAMMSGNIDEVSIVVAASMTHNKKNLNADTDAVMARYREISKQALKDKIPFRGYISCSFGCPYEGTVKPEVVLELAKAMHDLGAYEIAVGDTIGVGNPLQVVELSSLLLKDISAKNLALHMHDTQGMALANIWTALTLGISSFDSSVGGLGGCPYAPGASGNVATEDLINMLNGLKIESGILVDKLVAISRIMAKKINKALPAKLSYMPKSVSGLCEK